MYAKNVFHVATFALTLAAGLVLSERAAHADIVQVPAGPNKVTTHWSVDKTGSDLFFQVRYNRAGYQAGQVELSFPQYTINAAIPLTDYVVQGQTCSKGFWGSSCTPWNTGTFRVHTS